MLMYAIIFLIVSLNYLFIGINVLSKDYYSIKNKNFFNFAFAFFSGQELIQYFF